MNSDWTITVTANERERVAGRAKNILNKADRLSLIIISSRIPVSETT